MNISNLFVGIVASLVATGSCAQIKPGFQPAEARDMAALCTAHTFIDLYGSDEAILPAGYDHVYSSIPTPLDNKFDIYRKGPLGILEIRGSTAEMMSWMVNAYSSMIPAQGRILVNEEWYDYRFSDDTSASVHAGYTLSVVTLSATIIDQLRVLGKDGVNAIIITGHSQGGAIAQLMRAHLEHLPTSTLPEGMRFKTYAFASPMVGDRAFAADYERSYCTRLSSFSIVNPKDPIPGLPVSYDEGSVFSMQNLMGMLGNGEQRLGTTKGALLNLFSGGLERISGFSSTPIGKRVEGALGRVELPAFRKAWNYEPLAERKMLAPFDYPLILKDPGILENDSIMRVEARDSEGVFENKELYRSAPMFFHHKPYNYFVGILKRYFPEEYEALEVKVLPENL